MTFVFLSPILLYPRRWLIFVVVAFLMAFDPSAASAHPHIYGSYNVTVDGDENNITALHFRFRFQSVLNVFITNESTVNGQHGLRTVATASPDMMAALKEHPVFLDLDSDGVLQQHKEIQFYVVNGDKENPEYGFDVALSQGMKNVGFSVYDPEYYDSVSMDKSGLKISIGAIKCEQRLEKQAITVWGAVQANHVECATDSSHIVFPKMEVIEKSPTLLPDFRNNSLLP